MWFTATVMVEQPGGEFGFGWIYLKPANKSKVMETCPKSAWSDSEITFVTDITLCETCEQDKLSRLLMTNMLMC